MTARTATRARRTCPRCECNTSATYCCGIDLTARRRWRLTPQVIRRVHVYALKVKGLSEEAYRLNLAALGLTSSTEIRTRATYVELMRRFARYPDAPTHKPTGAHHATHQ